MNIIHVHDVIKREPFIIHQYDILLSNVRMTLSIVDIQNAQLQTLPNPCPYSTPSITIGKSSYSRIFKGCTFKR